MEIPEEPSIAPDGESMFSSFDSDIFAGVLPPTPILAPTQYVPGALDELENYVYSWDEMLQHQAFPEYVSETNLANIPPLQLPPSHQSQQQQQQQPIVFLPDTIIQSSPVVGPNTSPEKIINFNISTPNSSTSTALTQRQQQQQASPQSIPPSVNGTPLKIQSTSTLTASTNQNNNKHNKNGRRQQLHPKHLDFNAVAVASSHPFSSGGFGKIDKKSKNPSTRLPEEAIDALKTWLVERLDKPYPSKDEKSYLALKTGLTISQVNNWFINARRRFVKPMLVKTRGSSSSSTVSTIVVSSTVSDGDDGDDDDDEINQVDDADENLNLSSSAPTINDASKEN